MKITIVIGPTDGPAFDKLLTVLQALVPGFLPPAVRDQVPAAESADPPPSPVPSPAAVFSLDEISKRHGTGPYHPSNRPRFGRRPLKETP